MKRRWMKTVLENSMEPTQALPFHRDVRMAARVAPIMRVAQTA